MNWVGVLLSEFPPPPLPSMRYKYSKKLFWFVQGDRYSFGKKMLCFDEQYILFKKFYPIYLYT